jgi:hypothetical protein
VFLGLGTFAGWCGLNLAILALGDTTSQGVSVVVGTSQAFGVVATLWILARHLEEDHHSAFRLAADCTGPGPAGRLLGRWLGAVLCGWGISLVLHLVLSALAGGIGGRGIYLQIANIQTVALVGAWGLCVGLLWSGGAAVVAGLLAWLLGHLPWGAAGALPGVAGTFLRAVLPGPRDPSAALAALGYTVAATGAMLFLALAIGQRSPASTG